MDKELSSSLWKEKRFYGRKLFLDDAPELQLLIEDCEEYYWLDENVEIRGDEAFNFLLPFKNENSLAYGIFDYDNQLFGFMKLFLKETLSGDWLLEYFFLHPEARRMGIASEVLAHIRKIVASRGGSSITVNIKNQNKAALEFFKKESFSLFDSTIQKNRGGKANIVVVYKYILVNSPVMMHPSHNRNQFELLHSDSL